MLALDDPDWSALRDAYGSAIGVPELLKRMAESPRQAAPGAEPWFSLWSGLCHQGDVYTASYAAAPHIVEIARRVNGPIDFSFFMLPTAIEIARFNGRGPAVPTYLSDAYERAIASLTDCVSAHQGETWTQDMMICAAAAQAVARGHHRLAEALINLDDDWLQRIVDGERG